MNFYAQCLCSYWYTSSIAALLTYYFFVLYLYLKCFQYAQRQPEIHLFAARFREHSGDIPGSRAAYQLVHSEISPGLLEAIIKHANMEHRLVILYEQATKDSDDHDFSFACLNWLFSLGSAGESSRCLFYIRAGHCD